MPALTGVSSALAQEDRSSLLSMLRTSAATSKSAYRPRLLLHGAHGNGQAAVASAVLHTLEQLPVVPIDMPSLLADTSSRCVPCRAMRCSAQHTHTHSAQRLCLRAPDIVFVFVLLWSTRVLGVLVMTVTGH